MIQRGAEIDHRSNIGRSPLHSAAQNGHLEVCKLLIEKLTEKNTTENEGWTPLHMAANYGQVEVCKLIASHIGAKIDYRNNIGRSPLHSAAQNQGYI